MLISIIVAVSKNQVIGIEGDLPWRLSSDLRNFKRLTEGHTVIMGRKTYESIGKPLPKRTNVVITGNQHYQAIGCHIVHELEEAVRFARSQGEKEVFIIGGGEVYRQSIEKANRIYLTRVEAELKGDTFFPKLDKNIWKEKQRERFEADEKNNYAFDVVELHRV